MPIVPPLPRPDPVAGERWPGAGRRRETLIRLPIGELSAWHLMVVCGACRQDRVLGVGTLVERFGPEATLAVLLPRLRCHVGACKRPPVQVRLRNRFPQKPGPELVEVLLLGR